MNAKLQELIEIEVLSNEEYFIKVSQGNYKKVNRNYGGIDQVPNS